MNRFRLWLTALPRALRLLLIVNGVVYLGWQLILIHITPVREFVWAHLALNPGFPGILAEPWQLLTYSFLHLQPGLGGLLHVLFNMLWLVWIGRDLEELQGPARLFGLYMLGAAGGALLTVALHAAFPSARLFAGLVHGASGAVLAIMAGVALLYPQKQIVLLLLGPVRLIHLVMGFLALDLLFLSAGGTSVSAHLGGVLTGFSFARLQQRGLDITSWASVVFRRGPRSGSALGRSKGRRSVLEQLEAWLGSRRSPEDDASTSSSEAQVERHSGPGSLRSIESTQRPSADPDIDEILDKISASGYDSLTPAEKKALYEASQR